MSAFATRVVLGILGAQALWSGLWASVSPRAFYDEFPGLGRTWVAIDGPYNEHLIRDYGALNLALAAVIIAALVTLTRSLVATAGLAWVVWSVPHLVYHARHREVLDGSDTAAALGGIALGAVLALVVLLRPVRASPAEPAPSG